MKNRFILLFISVFVFFCSKTFAQNKQVDSLKAALINKQQDTNYINTLNSLAAEFKNSNPDTAIILSQKAINISQKLNYAEGEALAYLCLGSATSNQGKYDESIACYNKTISTSKNKKTQAKAYNNLGIVYGNQGNYAEALRCHYFSLNLKKEIGDKKGSSSSYNNIGLILTYQGNYLEALKNHFSALKIAEEMGDKKIIALCHLNLGNIYYYQENYSESLNSFLAALKIKQELGDKKGIASCYNNIGNIYQTLKKYDEAIKSISMSLDINKEINSRAGMAYCYNNLGDVYQNQGKYEEALKNYVLCIAIREEIGDKEGLSSCYGNIGRAYIGLHKPEKSKEWLLKGLILSKEVGSKVNIKENYLGLAVADSVLGNYKEAYTHYKMYVLYRDSLINEQNTKKIVQEQMQYKFDKKQTADSLKVAQERQINEVKFKQERTQRYALYGGLVLVVLFAGFMFNRFKVTQKQNTIISKQKQLIEERHKEITDSINYAERIQRSFLATAKHLNENLSEYFILFKPKDVVSGDFYWSATLNNKKFALATADSTGHGVPGAIMSLLNITSLEKAIETCVNPAEILNETRKIIIDRLKKDGSAEGGKDGMDCSLCVYDFKTLKLQIASSNNPVWIIRTNEIIEIKPDKMPVGKHDKQDSSFTLHEIQLQKGDVVYTLTDGFPDQFGGEKGKKFMTKNLRELLAENARLPMKEQKQRLEKIFADWVGTLEQVDDVTIIGVRI